MNPYLKRWQRMNKYPRDGETWKQFYERTAQRIEAETDETPQEVRPEGQEPDPKDAP